MIDPERFTDLTQRLLDETLDEDGAQELLRAIEASSDLREHLRTQTSMHALIDRRYRRAIAVTRRVRAALRDPAQKKGAITRIMERLDPKRPRPVEKSSASVSSIETAQARSSRRHFFLVAAALLTLLLVPALLYSKLRKNTDAETARVAWVLPAGINAVARAVPKTGVPIVSRGEQQLRLEKDEPLIAGDRLATCSACTVTLEYPDHTTISLADDTRLELQPATLKADAGIGIHLTRGEIVAVVAPQPVGKPMIVLTPHGRATIVGTRFTLTASATASRLSVDEGKVQFSSALTSESVLVAEHQTAVLTRDSALDAAATTRDPALWPFSANSPWNVPLGSAAQFAPVDSPRFDPTKGIDLVVDAYSIPIYIATPADPLRDVYRRVRSQAKQLRVPLNAKPDPTEMGLMNVVDVRHAKVYELIGVTIEKDGTLQLSDNSYYNSLQHLGVYADDRQHGTRIYGGSSMGGIVRKGELAGGIRHALGLGVVMAALNGVSPSGKPYVWPASNATVTWESMYTSKGNVYLGSLLAIPPNVDIRTIGVGASGPAYEMARALQDYGAYVMEHSLESEFDLKYYIEPAAKDEVPKSLADELRRVSMYLKVVTNNSAEHVGGGGIPRRQFAPPFMPEFVEKTDPDGKF